VYVSLFGNRHKFAAFNFYINTILTPPIIKQAKQQEWKIILAIAQNNGFPLYVIHNLKKKLEATPNHNNTTNQKIGNTLITQSTNMKGN
jgi:hypothetical protein